MNKLKRIIGFTLIELLISSAIFVIILIAVYSAFQTGIVSYSRVDAASGVYQAARIILARLEADIRNSYIYAQADSRFKGGPQEMDFYALLDSYDTSGTVYRDAARIRYEFKDGVLKRTAAKGADAFAVSGSSGVTDEFPDIQALTLSFAYPLNRANDEYDWQPVWPKNDEQKQLFPLAVKIEVNILETSKSAQPHASVFTKIVALPRANIP